MSSEQPNPNDGGLDIFGTREVLRLTIEKMQSQILLFGLALIVVLVVSWRFIGSGGALLLGSVLIVFGATLGSHMFLTIKREFSNQSPLKIPQTLVTSAGQENRDSTQLLRQIVNDQSSIELQLWVSNVDNDLAAEAVSGGDSRSIAVVPSSNQPIGNEASYRIGDRIRVNLQAGQNCYLTLLNVSPDGALTVVYPNALHPDNFLPAGRTIAIPGSGDGFDFQLEGPPGTEQLKAIATREFRTLLPDDLTDAGTIFRTAEPEPGARAIAVVAREVKGISDKQWDEATVAFTVEA